MIYLRARADISIFKGINSFFAENSTNAVKKRNLYKSCFCSAHVQQILENIGYKTNLKLKIFRFFENFAQVALEKIQIFSLIFHITSTFEKKKKLDWNTKKTAVIVSKIRQLSDKMIIIFYVTQGVQGLVNGWILKGGGAYAESGCYQGSSPIQLKSSMRYQN